MRITDSSFIYYVITLNAVLCAAIFTPFVIHDYDLLKRAFFRLEDEESQNQHQHLLINGQELLNDNNNVT